MGPKDIFILSPDGMSTETENPVPCLFRPFDTSATGNSKKAGTSIRLLVSSKVGSSQKWAVSN